MTKFPKKNFMFLEYFNENIDLLMVDFKKLQGL